MAHKPMRKPATPWEAFISRTPSFSSTDRSYACCQHHRLKAHCRSHVWQWQTRCREHVPPGGPRLRGQSLRWTDREAPTWHFASAASGGTGAQHAARLYSAPRQSMAKPPNGRTTHTSSWSPRSMARANSTSTSAAICGCTKEQTMCSVGLYRGANKVQCGAVQRSKHIAIGR